MNLEQEPGKPACVTCLLNVRGEFKVMPEKGDAVAGKLPVQECSRILEEFERICRATGEGRDQPDGVNVRFGGLGGVPIGFYYTTAGGEVLQVKAPEVRPSRELGAFMRLLWRKLVDHAEKHPLPVPADPFAPAKK